MKYFTFVILLCVVSASLGVRLECYTCSNCGKTSDTWDKTICSLPGKENFLCEHKRQNGVVEKKCVSNERAEIEKCDAVNKNKDDYCFYCDRDLCNVNSAQIHIGSVIVLSLGAIMRFVL
ncbi:hypothetical protein TcasGA2_TC034070 [Tribolium castaneum]|uniref:Protein sleepless n=1 Tax=Tribolium castaneum TaxID=7070 RepID=A0A139WD95_TRICA|nr:PREDICTED: uncharacterized protein LOC103313964 [Tribolium castaneum]KYB25837.1 hypothetical protein TcasGA2_TC034070 [Tribolium castaneum]|eukprot:XP_008196826.1 PREDICTED: uncharacterized protein LOC103313964 [Tribolium castaneum]